MYLTPFQNWLTCQYPHSSARKHIISDLALFFSWAGKPPAEISPQDVDRYIHHCLEKSLSPLTQPQAFLPAVVLLFPQDRSRRAFELPYHETAFPSQTTAPSL
jgi:hypothetical protein